VPDSFLTDLDAETLARLDTLDGRLDLTGGCHREG
jgi:hypothetical protein